jgi:ABC-2 type transport system ATP-binding protein
MSNSYSRRLSEVRGYFDNGDVHLGYRRLLDAALETRNLEVFRQTLSFADWFDAYTLHPEAGALTPRVAALLEVFDKGYTPPAHDPVPVRLEARGVSKKYARGHFSLSPLDVTLYPAEIIGLVGENGNGKTTLLRLLYGDLQPDKGTIRYAFDGQKPGSLYDTRSRIAFIPQRPQSWYGSLMDNLQFAAAFTGFKGEANFLWTEMMCARMGLRPYRTYNWSRISSGYKMRFELARTLLRQPQILLLDEPLANLDILAQQIILEDLRYLAQSETAPLSIVLSSQQLYEVEKVSDQVIFLQKGVARYQHSAQSEAEHAPLVIELETEYPRETLRSLFPAMDKLSYNGGVYLLYFPHGTELSEIFSVLGAHAVPVKYLRDISASSRRFFDA